jgi:hypothetical protein
MNTQGAALSILLFLIGSAAAEWLVSGYCATGTTIVHQAMVRNGNCAQMEGNYWQLIRSNTSGSILTYYCYDKSCSQCDIISDYEVVNFVDCATTPNFEFTTKTNPESDVIAMLGGMVYGEGNTYDNCTTSLEKTYYPANRCIPVPASGQAEMISCSPDSVDGWFRFYSDINCNHEYKSVYTEVGNGCNHGQNKKIQKRLPSQSFSFCIFQKS